MGDLLNSLELPPLSKDQFKYLVDKNQIFINLYHYLQQYL